MLDPVQVLPPGGDTCSLLAVESFRPYVYDGALHSFDITIPDASYVSIEGSVGGESIPFNLMTRRITGGDLRIHVDIETTSVGSGLPVSLTLVSARPSSPVCITTASFTVTDLAGEASETGPRPARPETNPPTTTSSRPGETGPNGENSATQQAGSSATGSIATSAPRKTASGVTRPACPTTRSSGILWGLLVLAFAVLGAVIIARRGSVYATSRWLPALIILSALALLMLVWVFLPSCRAGNWVPFSLLGIAVVSNIGAYWENIRRRNA